VLRYFSRTLRSEFSIGPREIVNHKTQIRLSCLKTIFIYYPRVLFGRWRYCCCGFLSMGYPLLYPFKKKQKKNKNTTLRIFRFSDFPAEMQSICRFVLGLPRARFIICKLADRPDA